MSRGRQYTSWAMRPKNRVLVERVTAAHFFHYLERSEYGLTYQSCRFCGTACFENEDRAHGACGIREHVPCRGLWKYAVRHYVCSDCRKDLLIGLPPAQSKSRAAAARAATIERRETS